MKKTSCARQTTPIHIPSFTFHASVIHVWHIWYYIVNIFALLLCVVHAIILAINIHISTYLAYLNKNIHCTPTTLVLCQRNMENRKIQIQFVIFYVLEQLKFSTYTMSIKTLCDFLLSHLDLLGCVYTVVDYAIKIHWSYVLPQISKRVVQFQSRW